MRVRSVAGVLGVMAALSWAAPAYATSYGSAASPVRITSNGNGWFYGNVTVYNHQQLRNAYYYRDTGADGNAVYVQTDWSYQISCDDGTTCFEPSGSDQSPRIGTADGKVHSEDYDTLDSRGALGRGTTKVCEDQSWSPDPCSNKVSITLSY
jgi:hypothetical protein